MASPQENSLFNMIRYTYRTNPQQVLIAYADNAAVLKGPMVERWMVDPYTKRYETISEHSHIVLKVETHNHPTAISPFPGAATGSGGEIRDEAATGRGASTKAGWCGFSVSQLCIPEFPQPWEIEIEKPASLASGLEIMLQGPIGAAAFNNEFGRPNLAGYFRTMLAKINSVYRGYHKPIMIAGGIGAIRESQIHKKTLPVGAKLIVLGGPAMAIGLGGGSASSRSSGENSDVLDFASVQRANPEMQRRCQEVINTCYSLGESNPILSIHDVGAGGLSNALPELVYASHKGAIINLRAIPNAAPGMTPLEIWCNEAQERFVLAIPQEAQDSFTKIAHRERCPFAVVGEVTEKNDLILEDDYFANKAVDMPMSILFDELPLPERVAQHIALFQPNHQTDFADLSEAARRVLQFPCVGSKSFLITIGDRCVTGLVARDQMVGPWQVPVADVAVTCADYHGLAGEAMAIGERPAIALIHPAAAARMAVGEAITNIAAASVENIQQIALSANWMAAAEYPGEGASLYDAVQTIALGLCPALGISIPVGKDSLSMQTRWSEGEKNQAVIAPISLVITAAAPVTNVRATLTPQLRTDKGPTHLILIDLGEGCNCMGGSVLEQVYQTISQCPPDIDDPELLKGFFHAIQKLNSESLLLAYHDRSDGGLFVTLCEMMFASHCGINIRLDHLGEDPMAALFNEELGAVIQVSDKALSVVMQIMQEYHLTHFTHVLGELNSTDEIIIYHKNELIYQHSRVQLQRWWSETSYHLQSLRDNQECATAEYDSILNVDDPGLNVKLSFNLEENISTPYLHLSHKPQVAILREQGINGHMEMAAAFDQVGFQAIDVHMSEILAGQIDLSSFVGLAAPGGFSYGDVLGAGRGWAQSILQHSRGRDVFIEFFQRPNTFTIGACNGCQMLADLKSLIPGAEHWPSFKPNHSEQFEGRVCLVTIQPSPAIFFQDMVGSSIPVAVAHQQGCAEFSTQEDLNYVENHQLVALRYVDNHHQITEQYPFNPNGSVKGITGLTNTSGRVLILMPHPERVFRTVQNSWHPEEWGEKGPWSRMFSNARAWVG